MHSYLTHIQLNKISNIYYNLYLKQGESYEQQFRCEPTKLVYSFSIFSILADCYFSAINFTKAMGNRSQSYIS